jgi:hypothetical protein
LGSIALGLIIDVTDWGTIAWSLDSCPSRKFVEKAGWTVLLSLCVGIILTGHIEASAIARV